MKSKILIIAMALCAPIMAFSQSNQQGTIQLGLGWGIGLGGATVSTNLPGNVDQTGIGAKANYGVRGQYGFLDNVSAGVYIRAEDAVYAVSDVSGDYSTNITYSGVAFGLEGKYYIVNKDRFALYGDLGLGFTTGTASTDATTDDNGNTIPGTSNSVSGINYQVGIGFNWWWADYFGMSLDFGYNGSSLSGTVPGYSYYTYDINGNPIVTTSPSYKETISNGNVTFGLGLVTKFGGSGGGGHHRRR